MTIFHLSKLNEFHCHTKRISEKQKTSTKPEKIILHTQLVNSIHLAQPMVLYFHSAAPYCLVEVRPIDSSPLVSGVGCGNISLLAPISDYSTDALWPCVYHLGKCGLQIYLCIPTNTTNKNTLFTSCSLQHVSADVYGRHQVDEERHLHSYESKSLRPIKVRNATPTVTNNKRRQATNNSTGYCL